MQYSRRRTGRIRRRKTFIIPENNNKSPCRRSCGCRMSREDDSFCRPFTVRLMMERACPPASPVLPSGHCLTAGIERISIYTTHVSRTSMIYRTRHSAHYRRVYRSGNSGYGSLYIK